MLKSKDSNKSKNKNKPKVKPPVHKSLIKNEKKKFGKFYRGGSISEVPPTRRPGFRDSSATIYQRPFTEQGRENFDKIFRK